MKYKYEETRDVHHQQRNAIRIVAIDPGGDAVVIHYINKIGPAGQGQRPLKMSVIPGDVEINILFTAIPQLNGHDIKRLFIPGTQRLTDYFIVCIMLADPNIFGMYSLVFRFFPDQHGCFK
jgi:hypothetical protein